MTAADVINPPPIVATSPYPILVGIVSGVALTILLLFVASKFDPTGGELTISLLITLGMLGAVSYCLIFTIPMDEITPGIVGGLTAGFGAVVAHWLGKRANGVGKGGSPPEPPKTPPEVP